MKETDLYPPVRAFLAAQGYEVKGEIGAADVVACRPGEPPVVVELKTGFCLTLLHQAVARQAVSDAVYVAVPRPKGRGVLARNVALCRRLGLGVLLVSPRGAVEAVADPGPYVPRRRPAGRDALLREFARRTGDPTPGGTRGQVMTAYRQDALRCRAALADGPLKAREVAATTGVARARAILADNHYGWFVRISRGVYALADTRTAATPIAAE